MQAADGGGARRSLVYGVTGSGKTVLATQLAERTGHDLVLVDDLCRQPGSRGNGNVETWRMALSQESIIARHFRSFARKRRRIAAWEADPEAPPVVRLRHPRATEAWLDRWPDKCRAESSAGSSAGEGG